MKNLTLLIIFLASCFVSAQTINGSVYDSISTLENIKITNLSSKQMTTSDVNGRFSIAGKIGDTLHASSLFYNEQKLVLKDYHFHESVVIELKQIFNNLDEVQLITPHKETLADIETVQVTLKNQFAEDRKNNPHLYSKQPTTGGIDIIQVIGLIAKLFENKDKYVAPPFVAITLQDLEALIETSQLFDKKLLTNTLNIHEDNINLFLQYLEAKTIDSELLKENKEVYLLEIFIKSGEDFKQLVDTFNAKNKQ
ncbi:hypothetical protein [Olleya sp. 1-3]|uniref:hypothetical protein n=1 Tax=Olleya sp. 1-3 TaxID=2058323 RepID=UPI0012FF1607|nr:hypothetical protein [Olleya sp. 1-3]